MSTLQAFRPHTDLTDRERPSRLVARRVAEYRQQCGCDISQLSERAKFESLCQTWAKENPDNPYALRSTQLVQPRPASPRHVSETFDYSCLPRSKIHVPVPALTLPGSATGPHTSPPPRAARECIPHIPSPSSPSPSPHPAPSITTFYTPSGTPTTPRDRTTPSPTPFPSASSPPRAPCSAARLRSHEPTAVYRPRRPTNAHVRADDVPFHTPTPPSPRVPTSAAAAASPSSPRTTVPISIPIPIYVAVAVRIPIAVPVRIFVVWVLSCQTANACGGEPPTAVRVSTLYSPTSAPSRRRTPNCLKIE
ncbi:hypothetical protein B0H16DRAFT_1743725 [Mycena metata]|uniref:Uncharacterized protein n=1 Tax=Mycena metata TaxID=1033252 RepID=A0AAD7H6T9_9AGAR|nr:hypothetical protein B0H16DRAFT_1743725 [Mycena metata]